MIKIKTDLLDPKDIISGYPSGSVEADIINRLAESKRTYRYSSLEQLKFEVKLRIEIIKSSRDLNRSKFKFKVFKDAICNPDYWELTDKGGFLLKPNVKPSDAINDIFVNSSKYGTECSTAIVILYYKAVLNIYPEELFNKTFPGLQLRNWQYIDDDLDIYSYDTEEGSIPGDCTYFENPEFDPEKSEWKGENAIDLGDGTYYGHGMGIKNADKIIKSLNSNRKLDATVSAFLSPTIANPNYKHLASLYIAHTTRAHLDYLRGFYAI